MELYGHGVLTITDSWEFGNTTLQNRPVRVRNSSNTDNLTDVIYLAAGGTAAHTGIIANDGSVAVWGLNSKSQLAEAGIAQSLLPIFVKATLSVNKNQITLKVGQSETIYATMDAFNVIKKAGSGIENIVYKVLNEKIATVGADGTITALQNGVTTLLVQDPISGQVATAKIVVGESGIAPEISSFLYHTVAIKADGTVWAWGLNGNGQLGDGSKANKYIPTQVDISDVVSVDAGYYDTLFLKSDGTVWATGQNNCGQLGDGTNTDKTVPVRVGGGNLATPSGYLENIVQIAAGNGTSYALDANGNVWAWGYNANGELGDNTTTNRNTPKKIMNSNRIGDMSGVTQISAGANHLLMLKADSTVWAVGYNYNGMLGDNTATNRYVPVQVKDTTGNNFLRGVIKVQAGAQHSVALLANGNVVAWGRRDVGQLGNGEGMTSALAGRNLLPTYVRNVGNTGILSDVIDISSGAYEVIALKSDGTAVTWGHNSNGQLGDGTTSNRNVPVVLKGANNEPVLQNIIMIAAGHKTMKAVTEDGNVYSWGISVNGEVGDDQTLQRNTPVCISALGVEVDNPYVQFNTLDTTQKVTPKLSPGFNLLYDEVPNQGFTYESMDENIATVDNDGNITSRKEGNTFIRITETGTRSYWRNQSGCGTAKRRGSSNDSIWRQPYSSIKSRRHGLDMGQK